MAEIISNTSQVRLSSIIIRLVIGLVLGSSVFFVAFIVIMTFAFTGINNPRPEGFWGSENVDIVYVFFGSIIAPLLCIAPLTLYLKNKLPLLKIVAIDFVLLALIGYFFYSLIGFPKPPWVILPRLIQGLRL